MRSLNSIWTLRAGEKLRDKLAYRHSGYPGGLHSRTIGELMVKHPDRVVEKAIIGMLPHNKLARQIQRKLQHLRSRNLDRDPAVTSGVVLRSKARPLNQCLLLEHGCFEAHLDGIATSSGEHLRADSKRRMSPGLLLHRGG